MTIKLFELRDRMTCICAMAVKLEARDDRERKLLQWAGYGYACSSDYVLLCGLGGINRQISYDQYSWDNRTMQVAHDHIINNFDRLEYGAVIDVEFLLGETKEPKKSEL